MKNTKTCLERKMKDFEKLELGEHNDAVYQEGRLLKVLGFLKSHSADDELVKAIEFELEDNRQWVNKDLLISGVG